MKKVGEMQIGPEATHSDICSMLDQLRELRQPIIDDDMLRSLSLLDHDTPRSLHPVDHDTPRSLHLVDHVNSSLSKLPSSSVLRSQWQKTQSQYQQVTQLIDVRRSELTEAGRRLVPGEKDPGVNRRSSAISSRRSAPRPQSYAGDYSPPVCHVKPTPISNETSTGSPTAPFDVRTYLIDKNAPITEPVFRPQLSSLIQRDAVKSCEVAQTHSSDNLSSVDLPCVQPVSAVIKSTSRPAASAVVPMQSRWKTLKKKAVGLLTDGLVSGRSPSQSEHCSPRRPTASSVGVDNFPRLQYSSY